MKALILQHYNSDTEKAIDGLTVEKTAMPQLRCSNELLIKVEATTCNPSDLVFMQGIYAIKRTLPAIPGFEAVGKVVDAGNEALKIALEGQRVHFVVPPYANGCWSEYAVALYPFAIPVNSNIPVEQAACMTINPFTAYGLIENVIYDKHESVIINAAMSQVASLFRALLRYDYVKKNLSSELRIINIVYNSEQAQALREQGEEFVLDSSATDFEQQLQELAQQHKVRYAVDAVGGTMTKQLLAAMQPQAGLVLYGSLSGEEMQVNTRDLITKGKIVRGFSLSEWLAGKMKNEEIRQISGLLQKMLIEKVFQTKIHKAVAYDNAVEALLEYEQQKSRGKVVIKF